jgi:flagellin-like protein
MNIRKNKKALSPVVASIILIAVTVAVSIAVAAWMGALTFSFMGSSSLTITNTTFSGTTGAGANAIQLAIKNTGTKQVTVGQVKINNVIYITSANSTLTYSAGTSGTIYVTNVGWSNGNPYAINLYDGSGNGVGSTQQNAPGA